MTRRTAIGTAMLAASWRRVLGANERMNIGVIGLGGRGTHLLNLVMKHRADKNDLEVVGLAEVYRKRLNQAASIATRARRRTCITRNYWRGPTSMPYSSPLPTTGTRRLLLRRSRAARMCMSRSR